MRIAVAPLAGVEVVLEIARRPRDRDHRVDRLARQHGPPEVGVNDRAGQVEYASQRRRLAFGQPVSHLFKNLRHAGPGSGIGLP